MRAQIDTKTFLVVIDPILSGIFSEGGMEALGRHCNLKGDSLDAALSRERLDFDLADHLLCKLGVPHYWYVDPLAEVYWSLSLDDNGYKCAHTTCGKTFTPLPSKVNKQRFCSKACRLNARRRCA